MNMKLKNIKVDFHRNGMAGNGFFVSTFDHGKQKMVAILFDEPGSCAVLDVGLLSQGVIKFAANSWRGDMFEPELRTAILNETKGW